MESQKHRARLAIRPLNTQFSKQNNTHETPEEWKTWRLSRFFTLGLLVVEVGMIILVIVLERISARNDGLATVPQVQTDPVGFSSLISLIQSYGLLWTALPAFLMGLYRLGWDAIVSGTAERQPYIDLNVPEDKANTAGRTIMLDYRAYPILYNWLVAFRMKHVVIGCAMILSSVLSIALVPLVSHLLVAIPTVIVARFTATIPNTFDSAQLMNLDLQPALSLSRATLAFNAEPPPWTTLKYSFEPFELKQSDGVRRYSVPVNAYYGQLDCVFLDVLAPQISGAAGASTITSLTYEVVDRGCQVPEVQIFLGDPPPAITVRTWATSSCGDEAHNSRIVMLTGNPTSATAIVNLTVTSCIPSYWKTTGDLTISAGNNSSPRVETFVEQPDNETEFRPFGADILEADLTQYMQMDPKGTFNTDLLAMVVYEVAKKSNPGNPLDSTAIKKALESVWPSVFTYLTTTFLIQHPKPRTVLGQEMRSETRLFVYSPVAWIIVVIMVLVAICNTFLIINAETNHSILQEEPKGLLGAAVLLQGSDVTGFVAGVRSQSPGDLRVRKTVKKWYTMVESKCWYDRDSRRIRLAGLDWKQPAAPVEERNSVSGSLETLPPATQNAPEALPRQDLERDSVSISSQTQPPAVQDTSEVSPGRDTERNSVSVSSVSQLSTDRDVFEFSPRYDTETEHGVREAPSLEHALRND